MTLVIAFAVRRVLREQTGLSGRVVRALFSDGGTTTYLVEVDPEAHPVLGSGAAVAPDDETLIDWAWHTVAEVDDNPDIEQLKRALADERA